jgi:hypothetical protein
MNHLFRAVVDRLSHASERERDELLALVDEVVPPPGDTGDADADASPEVVTGTANAAPTKAK